MRQFDIDILLMWCGYFCLFLCIGGVRNFVVKS